MRKIVSYICFLMVAVAGIVFLHSCANMAAPTGGLYDVDPPRVVRATPDFSALNVNRTVVEIEFDENIKIEKPNEKVIITPPQQIAPVIRSIGRRARVELNDELLPNTTYTIDFTDAIVDNNESNPLENFVYSFSTGDQLDTLAISGKVLSAENLEPVTGIYVGVHSNLEDTAFTHTVFQRISRTDSRGNFTVRGMAPGSYRVYALDDVNRDYRYDNPQEAIAFLDSIVIPSTAPAVRQDTVFVDSVTIDTIKTVNYTRFLPDDLVLRSFLSDFQRQFLQKHERPEEHKLNLFFAAPTQLPTFNLLNPSVVGADWYVMERNADNDSITLWVTDSLVYKNDSIRLKIDYIRTDSLNNNYIDTDTLNFNFRRPARERRAARNADEEPAVRFLGVNTNIQSSFETYHPIRIEFEQPVVRFDTTLVRLSREVDSVFTPISYQFEVDSLNPRRYFLRHRWEPEGKYELHIDSATVFSEYGLWNNAVNQSFTVKGLDQYANLEITLQGLPPGKAAFVELLDKSDKPFRKRSVQNSEVRFQDLPPGEIFLRLVIDENEDGVWTTGNYEERRQPEQVYYYPGKLTLRAYSDYFEDWNILSTPVTQQKPLEVTQNKPEERRRRDPNAEREQQRQQQNQQSSPFGGMRGGGGAGGPVPTQMR